MAAISQAKDRLPGAWHRGESLRTQVMQEAGLELSKSTFSHHLRIVREAGLVTKRIQGAKGYARLRKDDVDRRFPGLLDPSLPPAPRPGQPDNKPHRSPPPVLSLERAVVPRPAPTVTPVLMGTRSVQRRLAEGGEQRQAGHQPGDLITD